MVWHHSKTYYKYLLSYLALVLVGVLALITFCHAYFLVELKQNLLATHQEMLKQTAQRLDSDLKQVQAIDYQITCANDSFLTYYLSDDSPSRDFKIVRELKNAVAPTSFVAEVALFNASSDYVYTSTGAYARDIFFNNIYHFNNWPGIQEDISALNHRMVRPAETVNDTERFVTLVNTPSIFSRLHGSILLFFVKEEQLTSRLAPENGLGREGVILDKDGQIVVSTLPLLSLSPTDTKVRINHQTYLVQREQSDVSEWQYISLLPERACLAPLYQAQTVVYIIVSLTFLLGLLLTSYAMRVNYKPLKALTQAVCSTADGDELESLQNAIDTLSSQNESMRSQLIDTPDVQMLKDALLFSLLKNKFSSFEEFNQEGAPLGMAFTSPCYQVLMLRHFAPEDSAAPRPQLAETLSAVFGSDFPCYFRELFEPHMFVCMAGMAEGTEEQLTERCRQLLETLAASGLSFTIGASRCYRQIEHISAACFEATQAVREYFVCGRHQFIRYEQVNQTLTPMGNPLTALDGLQEQEPIQRMQTLRHFVEQLKAKQVPSLLAKSYCNYAVQQLLLEPSCSVNMSDLFSISYLRTMDDYLSFMLRLLEDSLTAAQPSPDAAAEGDELLSRIRAYLTEHYDSCNFSIQDAATNLHLSSSYMSQYFRQQTGETLTNYVTSLRIKKARTLLETTTMPLQMVSESVGYYNLNSFIRRFKQITSVTPGEYRRSAQ